MSGRQTTWNNLITAVNFIWSIWHAQTDERNSPTPKRAVTTALYTLPSPRIHTKDPLQLTTKTRLDSTLAVSTLQCYQHSGSNAARYTAGFLGSHCSSELAGTYNAIFRSDPCWLGSVLWLRLHLLQVMGRYRAVQKKAHALMDVAVLWYSTRMQICLCVLMFCDKDLFQLVTMLVSAPCPIRNSWYKHVPVYNISTS